MARFVLVHGAFGGAWCWEPVTGQLEAAGHTVEALDLPGSGDDETPVADVTLDAYADRVCATLAERSEPAVLVGYSMGGVVITQAAQQCDERIASLVFVCAFMPSNGQSLLDMTQLPEGKGDQIQENLTIEGDPPVPLLSAEATAKVIYNDCTSEQAAWAVSKRRPQAVAPYTTPVEIDDASSPRFPGSTCSRHATGDHARSPTADDPRAPVRARLRARRGPRAVPVGDGRARRGAPRVGRRARRVHGVGRRR